MLSVLLLAPAKENKTAQVARTNPGFGDGGEGEGEGGDGSGEDGQKKGAGEEAR